MRHRNSGRKFDRTSEHRMFHRDAGYQEGRRVRRSREMRAMARRTSFGKEVISQQWAFAEFGALGRLWSLGLPVPYPVQLTDEEFVIAEAVRSMDVTPGGVVSFCTTTAPLDALVAVQE